MAYSSQNILQDSIDDTFDQMFDQPFDQIFQNFTIHDDQEEQRKKKKAYIERNSEEGHVRLWNDYFSETPMYPEFFFPDDVLE